MFLAKYLKDMHTITSTDESLMRLLFYVAQNANDDVLDESRPDIIGNTSYIESGNHEVGSALYEDIIQDKIKMSSNADNLNVDDPTCQINLYFDAINPVNGTNGIVNKILLDLNIGIDMYVHREYDTIDARLFKIVSRLYELFYYKLVVGMGEFVMTYSAPITDKEETYDGFVGYRLKFKTRITAPYK